MAKSKHNCILNIYTIQQYFKFSVFQTYCPKLNFQQPLFSSLIQVLLQCLLILSKRYKHCQLRAAQRLFMSPEMLHLPSWLDIPFTFQNLFPLETFQTCPISNPQQNLPSSILLFVIFWLSFCMLFSLNHKIIKSTDVDFYLPESPFNRHLTDT